MDYARKIAPDTARFISESEGFDNDGDLESQRRSFEDLCQHFAREHPPVSVSDETLGGVNIRRYIPESSKGRILYFHGGGFVVGSLETHDSICADLAHSTGMALVSVDYRLAPEHKHPAALEDALAVRDALLEEDGTPLILVGDSAGGWIAAMVSVENPSLVRGQVLIYPALGAPLTSGSYLEHAKAPLLKTEEVGWYWEQYLGRAPLPDEVLEPMSCDDLPPETHIIGAECDPLADDGPLYAAKGGKVFCHIAKGLPHGFLRARYVSKDAGEAWGRIVEACKALV